MDKEGAIMSKDSDEENKRPSEYTFALYQEMLATNFETYNDLLCHFESCIFQERDICTYGQANEDETWCCDECIIIQLDDDVFLEQKRAQREAYIKQSDAIMADIDSRRNHDD